MTAFVKSWLDAAAAAVSTFAGVAYTPAVSPDAVRDGTGADGNQMMLPFGNTDRRYSRHTPRTGEHDALAA